MHIHIDLHFLYKKAYDWALLKGPGIVVGILILLFGFWLIWLFKKWLNSSLHKRDIHSSLIPFIQSLIITALQISLILFVMQVVGIKMTLFAAGIASFGVAVGLALSGTLQNFAGGVLILILKPFKIGDNIVAQGQDGIVSSIQIFYTVITTFDNQTVIIPNSKLSNEIIINISQQGKRRLDLHVKFPYTSDIEQIRGILQKIIDSSNDILKDPAPRMGISSLDPDGYNMVIELWVNALSYYDVRNSFQQDILKGLKESAIK